MKTSSFHTPSKVRQLQRINQTICCKALKAKLYKGFLWKHQNKVFLCLAQILNSFVKATHWKKKISPKLAGWLESALLIKNVPIEIPSLSAVQSCFQQLEVRRCGCYGAAGAVWMVCWCTQMQPCVLPKRGISCDDTCACSSTACHAALCLGVSPQNMPLCKKLDFVLMSLFLSPLEFRSGHVCKLWSARLEARDAGLWWKLRSSLNRASQRADVWEECQLWQNIMKWWELAPLQCSVLLVPDSNPESHLYMESTHKSHN